MALDRVRDQPSGIAVVAHVARDVGGLLAPAGDDRGALAREPLGGGPPDPERAADDEGDLALEPHGTSGGSVTSTKRGR